MQFTKDTFFITLRDRLAALNPERAVLVAENEPAGVSAAPDAFYLHWGACLASPLSSLRGLECAISYRTSGTLETGVDRGRSLASLDSDLLAICSPPRAPKRDYSATPVVDKGSSIFWDAPQLQPIESSGAALQRTAKLTVFFFPEEDLS